MLRLIFAFVLLVCAAQTHAGVRLYGDVQVGAGGVHHSDLDFYPRFGSFSAGLFVFKNIGVEGFVDTSFASAERSIFEVEVPRAAGVAVRFQSPPISGLQAYVLVGYVDFTLEQKENGLLGERTVRQTYDGARFSVGVQQRLNVVDGLIFGVEYRNYYADSGITVDGLSLGLRFEMQ